MDLPLIGNLISSNQSHMKKVLSSINEIASVPHQNHLSNSIAILGMTYKVDTSAKRRSPGHWLYSELTKEGFNVKYHDPTFDIEPLQEKYDFVPELEDLLLISYLVIIVVPWPIYLNIKKNHLNLRVMELFSFDVLELIGKDRRS